MNTRAADLANEYFIECERLVVVPVLTQQEVPYKALQEFYSRFEYMRSLKKQLKS